MTKKEILQLDKEIIFEKGMIDGFKHIKNICNACIKAHKESMRRKEKK